MSNKSLPEVINGFTAQQIKEKNLKISKVSKWHMNHVPYAADYRSDLLVGRRKQQNVMFVVYITNSKKEALQIIDELTDQIIKENLIDHCRINKHHLIVESPYCRIRFVYRLGDSYGLRANVVINGDENIRNALTNGRQKTPETRDLITILKEVEKYKND